MIYIYPFLLVSIALCLAAFAFESGNARRRGLDLGVVFMAILLMYGFVPGVGFLLAHQEIGQIIDERLSEGFAVADVEHVQWMHLSLVFGFMVGYFRRSHEATPETSAGLSLEGKELVLPLVSLAFLVPLLSSLIVRIWGADVGSDYISSYTVLRDAPLLVEQVFGVLNQLQLSAIIAAVVVCVAANPQRHGWVALALTLNMILSSFSGGSRATAFLAFFSYIVVSSIFVRSFSWRKVLVCAIPALLLFMFAGMLRDTENDAGLLYLFQSGEFTSLFVNAIDLRVNVLAGWAEEIRYSLYFTDLLRLIPSQLLHGVKLDPAQWYVQTFYPSYFDAGGGLAFGILAECVAGFGVPEAAARGLLLGLIFRFCRDRLMGRQKSLVKVFVYVWLVTVCYQSYRDTTFSIAVRALYQVVPVLLVIALTKRRDTPLSSKQDVLG
jgi:hypothetical protein